MQRVGANRRLKLNKFLSVFVCVFFQVLVLSWLILTDQLTKYYFKELYFSVGTTNVIDGFFRFTYVLNDGAAWSFLSGVSWAQTFFKILTSVALVLFLFLYVYYVAKKKKWMQCSTIFIISGTLGNFIDRLSLNGVIDFFGFTFGNYDFPIFNLADSFLVVGVIMMIFYYLFLDENAVFKGKDGKEELSNN